MKPAPPVMRIGPFLCRVGRKTRVPAAAALAGRAFRVDLPFRPRRRLQCVALIQSDLELKVRRWPRPPDRWRPDLPTRPPAPAILLRGSLAACNRGCCAPD